MAVAVPIATKYRLPITGEDLTRLLIYEAQHSGNETLARLLADTENVRDVAFNTYEGEGAVYFTAIGPHDSSKVPQKVATLITAYLKDIL